jgi:hypothetical protein
MQPDQVVPYVFERCERERRDRLDVPSRFRGHDAFFVKDLWFMGDWADTGMYAILRDEWLATQHGQ